MRKGVLAVCVLLTAIAGMAQQQQQAELYGSVYPNNANMNQSVQAVLVPLDGATDQQQQFLKALGTAPRKGTFICDNLANQQFNSVPIKNGDFDYTTTSSHFPVNQTIVGCGTVTVPKVVQGESVDIQYKIAFWNSVMAYANLKTQILVGNIAFVDACPGPGFNCETQAQAATPDLPTHSTDVDGNVQISDCTGNGPSITSLDVTVVPNNTQEQQDFNAHSTNQDACEANFPDGSSSDDGNISHKDDSLASFSVSTDFKGKGVGANVYICAHVKHYAGDASECDNSHKVPGRVFWKLYVTLYPDVGAHTGNVSFEY